MTWVTIGMEVVGNGPAVVQRVIASHPPGQIGAPGMMNGNMALGVNVDAGGE